MRQQVSRWILAMNLCKESKMQFVLPAGRVLMLRLVGSVESLTSERPGITTHFSWLE